MLAFWPSLFDYLKRLGKPKLPSDVDFIGQAYLTSAQILSLGETALKVAIEELGQGETTANNVGPALVRYKANGKFWCAGFVSYCYETAAERLGYQLPFKRSLGARILYSRIGAAKLFGRRVGQFVKDPLPGDVICWERGANGTSGHIGIVEYVKKGIVHTIEGNTGGFPSVVCRRTHDIRNERFIGYAGIRGL